jgi:type IV secretory pathway TraG/TraD family ATPase VirD4
MINEFISLRSIDPPEGQTVSPLTMEMNASPDEQVPVYWGAFTKAKRDLQGSILTGVIAKCQCFTTPNVKAVTSSEASDSRNGRFSIELSMLRHPSTAIYVVIPEGDAERYGAFLTTFFGLAMSVLRTIQVTAESVPALFLFDEAGNIPIHGLREMLGVGRGRKVAVVLAYQNLGQVYAQYGPEGGDAVLGSINTMIFLPGLDQRTTEFAAKRVGRTTVLQHTTVDAVGTKNDAERLAEAKRDLMDAAEIRQLLRFKQAVAIIDTAPPIKFTYPPFVQATLDELSHATTKGTPTIVSFKRAEIHGRYVADETSVENAASSPNVTELGNTPRQPDTHGPTENEADTAQDDRQAACFEHQSVKE